MTDTRAYLQQLILGVNNFLLAFEQCKLLADRIAADSNLSTATAQSAQTQIPARTDLSAADFDNFNAAMQLLEATLNGTNASVNTGGSVRLAFYKII